VKTDANLMTLIETGAARGLHADIPNSAYHAAPGLSSSGLSRLGQSAAHFRQYKLTPPEQTGPMMLGSAIHAMTLEGGVGVLKAPGSTRGTNLYKTFAEANPGQLLLLEEEYERASRAAEAVLKHPTAKLLLSQGKAEQSAFWVDPETQVLCKCRPDYLREDGVVIDLKSAQDASTAEFQRAITQRRYHLQSAWYLDGLSLVLGKKLSDFVHIVVESSAPYGVSIFALDDMALDRARRDIRGLLMKYAEAMHTDQWPGYPTHIQNLSLRAWEL
jgi:hypothetical protein